MSSPALTFVTILMLPSLMTVITLIIHRIRAARQAQLDRAPEDIVRNLPWQVWTGSGWEKHAGPVPKLDESGVADVTDANDELERAVEAYNEQPASASHGAGMLPQEQAQLPWFEQQHECAICLCEFVKGDRVRVLPCHHIFHLDEVDDWLINRKKLVSSSPLFCLWPRPAVYATSGTLAPYLRLHYSDVPLRLVPCFSGASANMALCLPLISLTTPFLWIAGCPRADAVLSVVSGMQSRRHPARRVTTSSHPR